MVASNARRTFQGNALSCINVCRPDPRQCQRGIVTRGIEAFLSWMEQQMIALSIVNSPRKIAGALVAGAVASGLFASAGLGLAPTANATCGSIFGLGNRRRLHQHVVECLLRHRRRSGRHGHRAVKPGFLYRRRSAGRRRRAFSPAFVAGNATSTATTSAGSVLNLACVIGRDSTAATSSGSIFNLATSLFGDNNAVTAEGAIANFATNIGGSDNTVTTQGSLVNTATNILGSGNTVTTDGRLCELGSKRASAAATPSR